VARGLQGLRATAFWPPCYWPGVFPSGRRSAPPPVPPSAPVPPSGAACRRISRVPCG